METSNRSNNNWTTLIVLLILTLSILVLGSMVCGHSPTYGGVQSWRTNVDGRCLTNVHEISTAIDGQSRAKVLNLLGTPEPDSQKPSIDVIGCLRPHVASEILYYSVPKYGICYCFQAVELSNGKVIGTYRTLNNPLWILFYVAVIAAVVVQSRWKRK